MKIFLIFIFLSVSSLLATIPNYYDGKSTDDIEVFQTRGDKKIAIRWLADSKNEKGPILIAINGGHGKWELKDSHITPSRIAMLMAQFKEYRALSLDMPNDEYMKGDAGGAGSEVYRLSKYQIDDIKTVLAHINKQNLPVFILTTSKSTMTGINAAGSDIPDLKGVILTAVSADLSKLAPFAKVRTLWIQHIHDKCFSMNANAIKQISMTSKNSTFVEVTNEANVSGKECSMTNYHGFVGRDIELVKLISDWIESRDVPITIK